MFRHFILTGLVTVQFLLTGQIDSAWARKNYSKQEVMIPMRDGIRLHTAIYTPNDRSTDHPVLMMRTPYSVAPYGTAFSPRLYTTYYSQYLAEGYIIVMQDVRGCYMSEGEFADVRPFIPAKATGRQTDESTDAYDAIEWIVKNIPSNNGKVGSFGISYPGFYATMTALSGHPALKAVSPQAPVTDWFMGDDFHHNGAFALMDGFSFYSGFGQPRPAPTQTRAPGFRIPEVDAYNFHLKQGALANYNRYMAGIPFWNELMEHPDLDDWWKARDARRNVQNMKPAVIVVGGTFDAEDCFGAWNLYKAIESANPGANNRIIMGPWFHGGWARSDGSFLGPVRFGQATSLKFRQNELVFFNSHLKGTGSDRNIAEATIFFTGANEWRELPQWPPSGMVETPLYLGGSSQLSFDKPASKDAFTSYISDPAKPVPYADGVHLNRTREYMVDDQRFAARRPDVLCFQTAELQNDVVLGGPVTVDLKVSLSTTDADFVVKLIDVFPDNFRYDSSYCCKGKDAVMGGYQMLVRGEIMRGRYRNSFSKPSAFERGKVETVRFALPDVAHVFRKGHRIMIQVQSSWFPLFDRNPQQFVNIYKCSDKDFVKSEIKVHHSAEHPSLILLPVIKTQ